MSVPTKALRLLLPGIAAAALGFGAIDAESSILEELQAAISLVDAGVVDVDDVKLTKRVVEVVVKVPIKGKQERKQVRYARWYLQLDGDQRQVYEREGWPTYRHREDYAGVVTERWSYADAHITYVFKGNQLVDTNPF